MRARARPALAVIIAGGLCTVALAAAWRLRGEYLLSADQGVGYGLGIAGLAMMLLLLGYSVRKRLKLLRNSGQIRVWFHIHMMLGLAGPTAILLHANFQSGSRNATVALISMLLVAGSGLIGRFIYTKIHYESLGRKATLRELRDEALQGRGALGALVSDAPEISTLMTDLEARLLAPSTGWLHGFFRFASAGLVTASARRRARHVLKMQIARLRDAGPTKTSQGDYHAARDAISAYFRALERAARFAGYARVFSAWHVLHLPLCVLLFAAAFFHVVAVHMY